MFQHETNSFGILHLANQEVYHLRDKRKLITVILHNIDLVYCNPIMEY